MADTYKINFKCWNCFEEFSKEILKGKWAEENAGECPYCGVKSALNSPKRIHKPFNYYREN